MAVQDLRKAAAAELQRRRSGKARRLFKNMDDAALAKLAGKKARAGEKAAASKKKGAKKRGKA